MREYLPQFPGPLAAFNSRTATLHPRTLCVLNADAGHYSSSFNRVLGIHTRDDKGQR